MTVELTHQFPVLPVRDVIAAQEYYRDVLRFEIGWIDGDEFGCVSAGAISVFFKKSHKVSTHELVWNTPDADIVYEQYRAAGVDIVEPIDTRTWGMREFVIRDLNGHLVRIGHVDESRADYGDFEGPGVQDRSTPEIALSISGVMVFCENIKTLSAFYRDVVGLPPDEPQPFPAHKFVRFRTANGAVLCLHSGTKPNGGRHKIMLESADIDGLMQRVKAFNRRVRLPDPGEGGSVVFDFRDPEGNRIQVYGRRPAE